MERLVISNHASNIIHDYCLKKGKEKPREIYEEDTNVGWKQRWGCRLVWGEFETKMYRADQKKNAKYLACTELVEKLKAATVEELACIQSHDYTVSH